MSCCCCPSAGADLRVPNSSPVLDKNSAPMGPDFLSSTGAGVWRKATKAFADSSSVLDKFQSAKQGLPEPRLQRLVPLLLRQFGVCECRILIAERHTFCKRIGYELEETFAGTLVNLKGGSDECCTGFARVCQTSPDFGGLHQSSHTGAHVLPVPPRTCLTSRTQKSPNTPQMSTVNLGSPDSQNLAVKELCFIPRGRCGGYLA